MEEQKIQATHLIRSIEDDYYSASKAIDPQQKLKLLQKAIQQAHPLHFKGVFLQLFLIILYVLKAPEDVRLRNLHLLELLLTQKYLLLQPHDPQHQDTLETIWLLNPKNLLVLLENYNQNQRTKALHGFQDRVTQGTPFLLQERKAYLKLQKFQSLNRTKMTQVQMFKFGTFLVGALFGVLFRKSLLKLSRYKRIVVYFGLMGISCLAPLAQLYMWIKDN